MFKNNRLIALVLGLMIISLVCVNVAGIFTYPKPDSGAYWIHDEIWSVTMIKNAISYGRSFYDTAIESSIEHKFQMLIGEHWLYVVAYGIPMRAIDSFSVESARIISFVLGIVVLMLAFYLSQRFHKNVLVSLLTVLIIASSTSFILATHCARYDLLTGLYLLGLFYFVSFTGKQFYEDNWKALGFGLYVGCAPLVSYHAMGMTICGVSAIYLALIHRYRMKYFKSSMNLFILLGASMPLLVTLVLSVFGIGNEMTLLKFMSGGENFKGEHAFVFPFLTSLNPAGIANQIVFQFLDFFEHNFSLMIVGLTLVVAMSSDVFAVKAVWKDFRMRISITLMFAVFAFYVMYRPAWATYAVFPLPIETVIAMSIFSVWLKATSFDFRFGYLFVATLVFLIAINENVRALGKRYDRVGLNTSLLQFEETIERLEGKQSQMVLIDGRVSNFLNTQSKIRYVTDMSMMFPSEITTNTEDMVRRQGIRYIIELSTANIDNSRLNTISINRTCANGNTHGTLHLLYQTTGIYEDAERDYRQKASWVIPDTLRLWKTTL